MSDDEILAITDQLIGLIKDTAGSQLKARELLHNRIGNLSIESQIWKAYGALLLHRELNGVTPLGAAAMYNHRVAAEILLLHLGRLYSSDLHTGYQNPIILAVQHKSHEVLAILLQLGPLETLRKIQKITLESKLDGKTALYYAVEAGELKSVNLLLNAGADVNTESQGLSVLALAYEKGYTKIFNALLGKNPDLKVMVNGKPILSLSAEEGDLATVSALLEKGADVNPETFDTLMAKNPDPNAELNGKPILYFAVERNDLSTVNALLAKGADVNATFEGTHVLCLAYEREYTDIFNALMAKNPKPNAELVDNTILYLAIEKNNLNGFKDLLTKGFRPRYPSCEDSRTVVVEAFKKLRDDSRYSTSDFVTLNSDLEDLLGSYYKTTYTKYILPTDNSDRSLEFFKALASTKGYLHTEIWVAHEFTQDNGYAWKLGIFEFLLHKFGMRILNLLLDQNISAGQIKDSLSHGIPAQGAHVELKKGVICYLQRLPPEEITKIELHIKPYELYDSLNVSPYEIEDLTSLYQLSLGQGEIAEKAREKLEILLESRRSKPLFNLNYQIISNPDFTIEEVYNGIRDVKEVYPTANPYLTNHKSELLVALFVDVDRKTKSDDKDDALALLDRAIDPSTALGQVFCEQRNNSNLLKRSETASVGKIKRKITALSSSHSGNRWGRASSIRTFPSLFGGHKNGGRVGGENRNPDTALVDVSSLENHR